MIVPLRILIAIAVQSLIANSAPVGICLHAYSPEAPAEKIECFEFEKVERAAVGYRFYTPTSSIMVTAYRFRGTIPYKSELAPTHPEFDKLLKLYEETARATPSTRRYLNPKILAMRGQAAGVAKQIENVAKLPTITMADGTQLTGCTMSKIENGFVSIRHQDGISKVSLKELDATEKKALNSTAEGWSLEDPVATPQDSTGTFAKIVFKNGLLLKKAKFKEVADGNLVFMVDGKRVPIPTDQFPGDLSVLGEEVIKSLAPLKKKASPESTIASSGGKIYENSLGMKFVPVPIKGGETDGQTVLFCVWETRNKDFKSFVAETGYNATSIMDDFDRIRGVREDGVTMKEHWADCGFIVTPDHPVSWMSWQDGQAFCEWLTKKERDAGLISKDQAYRLPLDHEWSCAAGIGDKENASESPEKKSCKLKVFPWKAGLPPPKNFGNYAPSLKADSFEFSSRVGSFTANNSEIYDMDGNVSEWCEYVGKDGKLHPVGRGSDFAVSMVGNEDQTLDYRFIVSDTEINNGGFKSIGIRGNNSGFRCVLATELKLPKYVSAGANNGLSGGGFMLPEDEAPIKKNPQTIPSPNSDLHDFKAIMEHEVRGNRLKAKLKEAGEYNEKTGAAAIMTAICDTDWSKCSPDLLSTSMAVINAVNRYVDEKASMKEVMKEMESFYAITTKLSKRFAADMSYVKMVPQTVDDIRKKICQEEDYK